MGGGARAPRPPRDRGHAGLRRVAARGARRRARRAAAVLREAPTRTAGGRLAAAQEPALPRLGRALDAPRGGGGGRRSRPRAEQGRARRRVARGACARPAAGRDRARRGAAVPRRRVHPLRAVDDVRLHDAAVRDPLRAVLPRALRGRRRAAAPRAALGLAARRVGRSRRAAPRARRGRSRHRREPRDPRALPTGARGWWPRARRALAAAARRRRRRGSGGRPRAPGHRRRPARALRRQALARKGDRGAERRPRRDPRGHSGRALRLRRQG